MTVLPKSLRPLPILGAVLALTAACGGGGGGGGQNGNSGGGSGESTVSESWTAVSTGPISLEFRFTQATTYQGEQRFDNVVRRAVSLTVANSSVGAGPVDAGCQFVLQMFSDVDPVNPQWSVTRTLPALAIGGEVDFGEISESRFDAASFGRPTINMTCPTQGPVLSSSTSIPMSGPATSVAFGDLTGDGIEDVIVASFAQDQVYILRGLGSGHFVEESSLGNPGSGNGTNSVATGDFNGDGTLDFVVGFRNDRAFRVFIQTPRATQVVTYSLPAILDLNSLTVADMNGDGILDIVTASSRINRPFNGLVGVHLGNGNGTFVDPTTIPYTSVGNTPWSVVTEQLDNDRVPDVVTANWGLSGSGNNVNVLLNDGTGSFPVFGIHNFAYPVGQAPLAVATGDFNGDGMADIVVANSGLSGTPAATNTVTVLLNDGTGRFQPGVDFPVGNQPEGVAVGDLDGDGNADLAVSNALDDTVTVLLGDGAGNFQKEQDYAVGDNPSELHIRDIDGDGDGDVVVGLAQEARLQILIN